MAASATDAADLVDAVVRFCRHLRSSGVRVHPDSSQSALLALREVPVTSRDDFRTALLVSVVHRPEDLPLFDYAFNQFWDVYRHSGALARAMEALSDRSAKPKPGGGTPDADPAADESSAPIGSLLRQLDEALGADDSAPQPVNAAPASIVAVESAVPNPRSEADELDRLARELAPLVATRRSRRWMRDPRGGSIDLRGARRGSLRYGGAPIELPRRKRRLTRTRLVVFCDVSRSMDEHAEFFLRFSAAVLRRLWRVEVFLFATDVVRVTPLWLRETWKTLKLRVPDCGGGTQIGHCLSEFLRHYETSLLNAHTIVAVFSDGLDAGDPEVLERALQGLKRRCHALLWLNPLLHLPGYEPTARGMAIALKYIDLFAPAHDVGSLRSLVDHLRAIGLRPASHEAAARAS